MRDIIFRGKRTDNNEWVYGSLVTMDDDVSYGVGVRVFSNMHIIEKKNLEIRSFLRGCEVWSNNVMIQIIKTSAGQYTGIKDKHGTKIFEGDVIEYRLNGEFDGIGYVEYMDCQFYTKDKLGEEYRLTDLDKGYSIEIVGNIHDNKDLV